MNQSFEDECLQPRVVSTGWRLNTRKLSINSISVTLSYFINGINEGLVSSAPTYLFPKLVTYQDNFIFFHVEPTGGKTPRIIFFSPIRIVR